MDWLWPGFLILLGLIPLLVGAYVWVLRRRRRYAVRYSSLALVRAALPQASRLRRHLPFALFLVGLASLVLALARPLASVRVPVGQASIILAIDVSRSMCSTDIQPNRLEAARSAALSFLRRQAPGTQIGIVAFAGFAQLVQAPTSDLEALERAVKNLLTARRTAIGSAILEALDAIAEIDETVAPSGPGLAPAADLAPGPPEAYAPHVIVLLTDGASNTGPFPLDAAQQAVDRRVRVYTIGFGTEAGQSGAIPFCGQPFAGDGGQFGGGSGFGGGNFRRGIDEDTLREISAMTGGAYYAATSADELQEVFRNLPTLLATRRETVEVSVGFTALGALLAALALAFSLLWQPLP